MSNDSSLGRLAALHVGGLRMVSMSGILLGVGTVRPDISALKTL